MLVFFSFFKQKTAYERRISDWSSDVCYSDLHGDEDNDCYLVSVEIHGRNALCLYQGRSLHGEVIQSLTCPNITPAAVPRPSTCAERERSRCPAAQSGRISGVLVLRWTRSEEHTSELHSLMRISYAVFCLKKKKIIN